MRPHVKDADDMLFFKHLVYETVLDIDAAGIHVARCIVQFFVRRGILEGVCFNHADKHPRLLRQPGRGEFFLVFFCLA